MTISSPMRSFGLKLTFVFIWIFALTSTQSRAAPSNAQAFDYDKAPKLALIIGNQRYSQWPVLHNTKSDAKLIASTFKSLGYQTTLIEDADNKSLRQSLGQFSDQLVKGGVAAVYYAGHGVQYNGRNYLVPTDMPSGSIDARSRALAVDELLKTMRFSGAQVSLILLDACRNDPNEGGEPRRWRGSANEGFAEPVKVMPGMLVAYATQPGERAMDGSGANGPFAKALARWLPEPEMNLTNAMEQVKRQVRDETQDDQRPMVESTLVSDFPLNKHATTVMERRRPPQQSLRVSWFFAEDNIKQMSLTNEIARRANTLNQDDIPLLEHQANHGSAMAQAVLGTAWRQGFGVGLQQQRSAVKAKKWLGMAASQHMPYALNELGEMFFLGQGGPKQVEVARKMFQEAADSGYQPAKLNLLQLGLEMNITSPEKQAEMMADMLKQLPR